MIVIVIVIVTVIVIVIAIVIATIVTVIVTAIVRTRDRQSFRFSSSFSSPRPVGASTQDRPGPKEAAVARVAPSGSYSHWNSQGVSR